MVSHVSRLIVRRRQPNREDKFGREKMDIIALMNVPAVQSWARSCGANHLVGPRISTHPAPGRLLLESFFQPRRQRQLHGHVGSSLRSGGRMTAAILPHRLRLRPAACLCEMIQSVGEATLKRGCVDDPLHWRYSSARNYAGQQRLLDVVTDRM